MTRTPHLLDVPVLRQATGYECGNTALAAVMQFLGEPRTPAELATLASTTPDGTDHANLVAAARATGASVTAKEDGTLDEIAAFVVRGLPVIVGWWPLGPGDEDWHPGWSLAERRARDCGHFSVIHGITDTGVVLMDPDVGSYELTFPAFDRAWYDTDTEHYVKVTRWYLVLDYAGNPLSS